MKTIKRVFNSRLASMVRNLFVRYLNRNTKQILHNYLVYFFLLIQSKELEIKLFPTNVILKH